MKYTFTKTTKNILDFFGTKMRYTYSKLDGLIYKDVANDAYFQIVDMQLDIEKGTYRDSQYFTINKETQYRPDKLAYIAYGDETLAWIVLRFNNITNPFELEIGRILEFPSLNRVYSALQAKRQKLQYR